MSESTRPQPSAEPVAWMYFCIKPVGDRQHLDPAITSTRRLNLDPTHWTETPLYPAAALDQARREGELAGIEKAAKVAEIESLILSESRKEGSFGKVRADHGKLIATAIRALKENPNAG